MAKVLIQDLHGDALDWAVALFSGMAMRKPIHATNKDLEGMTVPFTLYESSYTYRNDVLVGVEASPITVTRFGINTAVGATAPSISFTDSKGRQALGSARDYYLDPAEAELEAIAALKGSVEEFNPSKNAEQALKILCTDRMHTIHVASMAENFPEDKTWGAAFGEIDTPDTFTFGSTRLQAAMRCLIANQCKETWIDIPDELAVDQIVINEPERQTA